MGTESIFVHVVVLVQNLPPGTYLGLNFRNDAGQDSSKIELKEIENYSTTTGTNQRKLPINTACYISTIRSQRRE